MSETPKDSSPWNQHGPWLVLLLVSLLLLGAALAWPHLQKRGAIRELERLGFVYNQDDQGDWLVEGPYRMEYQHADLGAILGPLVILQPGFLTMEGCEYLNDLSGLEKLTTLEALYLFNGRGLKDTSSLARLKGLRWLSLTNCTGLKGSDALQGLAGLLNLESLDLRGCTGLVEADVEALRKRLGSGCKVQWP